MRLSWLLVLPLLCHAQAPADLRGLVRDSVRFLAGGDHRADEYTSRVEIDRKQVDMDGNIKSAETIAGRREFQDGISFFRVLERNGKALTEQERQQQEEGIRKHIQTAKSAPSPAAKPRSDSAWVTEVPEALDFQYAGEEMLGGRTVHVLACSPRPGYTAKSMRARVFEKTRGKLWIDKQDRELVKANVEVFDTVSIALGLLGKVEKGTRFSIQRRRLPEGVWLVEQQTMKFGARVALVKWIGREETLRLSDFRHRSAK